MTNQDNALINEDEAPIRLTINKMPRYFSTWGKDLLRHGVRIRPDSDRERKQVMSNV